MSDRFPHSCFIGGVVDQARFNELKGLAWESGWDAFEPPAPGTVNGRATLFLQDSEARADQYDDFLKQLREWNLPYDYCCSGRYEYAGEVQFWRPGMDNLALCQADNGDNPVLTCSDARFLIKELEREGADPRQWALWLKKALLLDIPALPPFVVS